MADPLSDFLSRAARCEWRWGSADCFLFMADWVLVVSGRDPALAWRGKYQTARGARMIIVRAGGLEKLVEKGLSGFGWRRTETPVRGDIGLVSAPIPGCARDNENGKARRGLCCAKSLGGEAVRRPRHGRRRIHTSCRVDRSWLSSSAASF
jgi:hypothetical protein